MAGKFRGATRFPAQDAEQRRHPGPNHRQSDRRDAKELAHHQFTKCDGRKQNLDDAVRFFLDGIVEQHLDDHKNGEPEQIDEAAWQPLLDRIHSADGLMAGGFPRIETRKQHKGPLDLAHGCGVQPARLVLPLANLRVNRLLDLIPQP